MKTAAIVLTCWTALSFVVGPIVGRYLAGRSAEYPHPALLPLAAVPVLTAGDLLVLLLAGMGAVALYPLYDLVAGWLADGSDASEETR